MATRTFIFCDICNPEGIRIINQRDTAINRRDADQQHTPAEKRADTERREFDGRRNTDGRAWHEGSIESSIEHGWTVGDNNNMFCPKCSSKHFGAIKFSSR